MQSLKFSCFNCRGIADPIKRRDIFNWINQKNLDICILTETHSTPRIENAWRAEWDAPIWFSSYKSNSRGVAILFKNSIPYTLHNVLLDNQGRYVIMDVSIQDKRISLVGLYGPNEDDPNFFNDIKQKLSDDENQSMILAGDWNVVLDYEKDCKNYVQRNNTKANKAVIELKTHFELEDVWRVQNPDKQMYTWFGPNRKMGRIDYMLVSSNLTQSIKNPSIDTGYRSDHSLCHMHISFKQQIRGRGTWKFNNSLLHDETYVKLVKQCISEVVNQYKINGQENVNPANIEFDINDQLFFETLKFTIRGKTIPYCARKKRDRDKTEITLFARLEDVSRKIINNNNQTLLNEKLQIENDLQKIRIEKTKGSIIRSKAKWIKEGEKGTKYFCNLENRNYVEKSMESLILEDGTEVTNIKDIMNAQNEFYHNLYTTKQPKIDPESEKLFFDDENPFIQKLSAEEAESCEGELTLNECLTALKNMSNEKSPGSDGYTVEFFKFFWKDLGHYLLRALNYSLEIGQLSITQRHGIITCIPKPGKLKTNLKSWRPITLLNVDLKIASAAISNRMKRHLSHLISDSQKGYIKDRYIGECTRLIYDILYETKKRKLPGLLLLIDFEKAFDSIEWAFLDRALKYFGFKNNFCQWVKLFYTDITSSVINNGHLSQQFTLTRGVRQGDPLSPYLFILAVECLSAAIKYHPNINGIKIDESEYLISQLADDTTLILDGSKDSLENSLNVFEKFEKCSGLKVNLDKTQATWIGNKVKSRDKLLEGLNLDWNFSGSFKLLGIHFNIFENDPTFCNYDLCLQKIKILLNNWKWRPLTVIGKISVVKTLALSKLVHLFMTLPNPSNAFLKALESVIYQFIWSGSKDKIKRTTLIGKIEQGGLNMTHLESFCNSLKVIWVKKVIDNLNSSDWKILFLTTVEKFGENHLWYGNNYMKCKIVDQVNPFWADVLKVWGSLPRESPTTAREILSESIWYNNMIKKQGQPIFYPVWFSKGVKFVNDLVDENGSLLSYGNFQQKYDIQISFIEYNGLIGIIPNRWKDSITTFGKHLLEPKENYLISRIKQIKKASKVAYELLRDSTFESPTLSQNRWKIEIQELQVENWECYYNLVRQITPENKLQFFQYQILHRILVTNSKLFYFGIKQNNNCSFCEDVKENLIHLFWECRYIQNFWAELNTWLNQKFNTGIILDRVSIVFGNLNWEDYINCTILWAKYYIYCVRCKNMKPSLHGFHGYFYNYLKIEQFVDKNKWSKKWGNNLNIP